jgi:hypothetical protein
MMENIKDQLAVLVVSCDKYADLWKPFFECFKRFWPDCPFNVYLMSNKKPLDVAGVKNILTGDDLSWSDSMLAGINQLKEEYVLLFLDDLFLYKAVDTGEILRLVNWAVESKADYLRMNPMYNKADTPFNESVGIISKNGIYRTSTVMSMWKKTVLTSLLKPGESAWDLEVRGAARSDIYDGFYAAWNNNFPIINTVIKGKWSRRALKKMRSLNITIDLASRKVMTAKEETVYSLKHVRSYILSCLPVKYRKAIKKFFSR